MAGGARRRSAQWVFAVVFFALGALFLLVFIGRPLPFCTGIAPTGQVGPECYDSFLASLSWFNRLLQDPVIWRSFQVAVFVGLAGATFVVSRVVFRKRKAPPTD
jgi:ABC-type spermidine/putrescine transport system permease subunit II